METSPGLRLLIDFVNTLEVYSGSDTLREFLTGDDRVSGYGLADPGALAPLRAALRKACRAHAGIGTAPDAAASLNTVLATAPLTVRVDPGGGAELCPAPGLAGAAEFTARLAAVIAAAQAEGSWGRVKACGADDCEIVYYDRSPAGRRRWCDMAVCGSRTKMRRYRAARASSPRAGDVTR